MNVNNRKCIQRLSWRSLWASRKRNIIAIIAIALTTLMFTSLFTIAMSITSSYEMYMFRQIGGYCHGTFKNVTEKQIQELSAHSNIKATGKRIVIGYLDNENFSKTPAEFSFMDNNCAEWCFTKPIVGHNPQSGKEITMDIQALKNLDIEPELGKKIELSYTVGISSDKIYKKTDTFTLVGWWEYDDIGPVHFINTSEEYAKQIEAEAISKGMEPFRTELSVMTSSSLNIYEKLEQTAQDLGYSVDKSCDEKALSIGVNWGYTSSQISGNADSVTILAILAFILIVMLTGYLIIYNIFQISVTGDIRFYGLLKTIGVTPVQLCSIIRQQALLLCAVGIPIGLLLGFGVGAVLTPVVISKANLCGAVSTVSTSPLIFIASILFAIATVLLSCHRPGKIAGKVSPIEATKYTEATKSKKKHRTTRGAKVYQMAFANLGRNKSKTFFVVVSLAFSVILLNILVTFTSGFDMEKFLSQQSCADFVVSTTDYFNFSNENESYISQEQINEIQSNTNQTLSGCGYTIGGIGPMCYMSQEAWLNRMSNDVSQEFAETTLVNQKQRGEMIEEFALIEGLDKSLFEKLTVVEGDISPMLQEESNSIALVVYADEYGNIKELDKYPKVGTTQTITYGGKVEYIDKRTGEICDENTPAEFIECRAGKSHDVNYTICAYVTVPNSMSYRYQLTGYSYVLPVNKLALDSKQEVIPMVYLFDTADSTSEKEAENYLAELTSNDMSGLMYQSKTTLREEFGSFQNLFLLMGGIICAIIGIIGILNFFNAIMTGILSRRREFAVLQAVGMTNKQLKAMLVYEGFFYALSSALIALILSLVFNPLIGVLFEKMFWFFSANFTIVPVIIAVPIFALLGWLIPYIMYNQTAKYSIIERLKDN